MDANFFFSIQLVSNIHFGGTQKADYTFKKTTDKQQTAKTIIDDLWP